MCSNNLKQLLLECNGTTVELLITAEEHEKATKDLLYTQNLFDRYVNDKNNSELEEINLEDQQVKEEASYESSWSEAETMFFISLYEQHKDDFSHAKKRKHVLILIAEQMAARNYIRDAVKLERKWTNLMRVYRAIKDNKGPKKSGRGGQNYKYFERIDEIVGNKPSNTQSHNTVLQIGVNNEEITPVRVNDDEQTSSDFEVESIVHQKEITGVLTNGSKRRKSNSVTLNKQIMLEKAERHRELIEIEKEKLIIEKRKVELLEKLVMLQNKT